MPPSELDLIRQARVALGDGKLRRALGRAERHASLYHDGVLSEEREAIAIEALVGLRRVDAARARLDAFVAAYPASSYRQRLRELVEAAE
jgi:hypothetical protein